MKKPRDPCEALARAGLKKTLFRQELLKSFINRDSPLAAAQILARLEGNRKLRTFKFDRATLFRNLKILVEKGLLTATEFGTGRAFYRLSGQRHHHHVFCVRCESVRPLKKCAAGPMIEQAKQMGFEVLEHRLELLGVCPECRS
jgi:Fur family ferric uptake transcriptional regulator